MNILKKSNGLNKYNTDRTFFNKIDTHDKAYLLGWIASDGHISKYEFSIKLSYKDKFMVEKLRDIINKNIPIKTSKTPYPIARMTRSQVSKIQSTYMMRFCGVNHQTTLRNL